MSLTRDGVWKAGVWAPTVWADGVWFEGARQTVGGGGGGPLDMGEESPPFKPIIDIREPADRFREQREKNARVREQLRVALEGPQAEEVRELVEPLPSDSVQPLYERIDIAQLADSVTLRIEGYFRQELARRLEIERRLTMEREARARYERELDDDDDEVTLLL